MINLLFTALSKFSSIMMRTPSRNKSVGPKVKNCKAYTDQELQECRKDVSSGNMSEQLHVSSIICFKYKTVITKQYLAIILCIKTKISRYF